MGLRGFDVELTRKRANDLSTARISSRDAIVKSHVVITRGTKFFPSHVSGWCQRTARVKGHCSPFRHSSLALAPNDEKKSKKSLLKS